MKSSRQLMEWLSYSDVEPFDEIRADLRAARICAAVYNARFGTKVRPIPFTLADFMPDYLGLNEVVKSESKQDWQVLKALFKGMVEEQNRG